VSAEELYELVFTPTHRGWLCVRVGPEELEDALQDVYLAALQALDSGAQIRDFKAYVNGIVDHVASRHIHDQIRQRTVFAGAPDPRTRAYEPDPERLLEEKERRREVLRTLSVLSPRDRELLARAYLCEEPTRRTMAVMRLSSTQYRLYKTRAKSKVAKLAARTRAQRRLQLVANKRAA
jgi:RNA polymerase sigma factor (sigma-70 family)